MRRTLFNNEAGYIFIISLILLSLLTANLLYYSTSYNMQITIYNSLESVNVRATISILNKL